MQTIIPDYRLPLFRALRAREGGSLGFAAGERYFTPALFTAPEAWSFARRVENRYFAGRSLLWQDGLLETVREAELVIAEFNLRALSTWRLLGMRSKARAATVLWGHARGKSRRSRAVRAWMFENAAGMIAYTETQRDELRREFPRMRLWAVPNAVMSKADCFATDGRRHASDVILVGRLVEEKKPRLALEAFALARTRGLVGQDSRLHVVGAGPLERQLRALGRELTSQVVFHGHVNEPARLRALYGEAFLSLSTGYVGLSAIQSFGHGVPMIVARDEPHSPEIEACVDGRNCRFVPSDDATALAIEIGRCYAERDEWHARGEGIAAGVRSRYTYEAMAERLSEIIGECS